MFPDRVDANGAFEVPKLLIFAKTDSHAEDIIEIVREEFGEENRFCKKITYRSEEDPKSVLQQFRNDYYPRIAVTVDMIATGTDIRPLEVLLFMRDVKSKSYYEQMKGRGTRTCSVEELRAKGTPSAKYSKDHFVIIDAIGVESSQKTDSRPLEKAPGMALKDVLQSVAMGNTSEELLSTLANRLIRLDRQLSEKDKLKFAEQAGGKTISHLVKGLLNAHDPDTINNLELSIKKENPEAAPEQINSKLKTEHSKLIEAAVAAFHNPELRDFIVDIRKKYDQVIDVVNMDSISNIGWVKDRAEASNAVINDFKTWIEEHKDEIIALQIFYGQPYQRRSFTYKMIKDLCEKLKTEKPVLAPLAVWKAYEQLDTSIGSAKNELIALVSLIRNVAGIDAQVRPFDKTVDNNFATWVWKKQAGNAPKFNEEQMHWLRMMKDYIASSFSIEKDDFDLSPFNAEGGLSKVWALFGDSTEEIMNELNEALIA